MKKIYQFVIASVSTLSLLFIMGEKNNKKTSLSIEGIKLEKTKASSNSYLIAGVTKHDKQ